MSYTKWRSNFLSEEEAAHAAWLHMEKYKDALEDLRQEIKDKMSRDPGYPEFIMVELAWLDDLLGA